MILLYQQVTNFIINAKDNNRYYFLSINAP